MDALVMINNLPDDYDIEKLRANIKINCYGETIAEYSNVVLKAAPKKKKNNDSVLSLLFK